MSLRRNVKDIACVGPLLVSSNRICFLSGYVFMRILAVLHEGDDFNIALTRLRNGTLISFICLLSKLCFLRGILFLIHSFVARMIPNGILP